MIPSKFKKDILKVSPTEKQTSLEIMLRFTTTV